MAFKFNIAGERLVELPNGEEVSVREPNINEISDFKENHSKLQEKHPDDLKRQLKLTVDFLAELGFPADVAYKATDKTLLEFINWLCGEKKS